MTSGLVDLVLPCRLISLKVRLGPERGVTTLEELTAKAILAGRTSVERLAELFGLPRRLLLDVVLSLWDKGYVSVDMESGIIELSESARDILVSGGSMVNAAAEVEERQFLFEPITGRIVAPAEGMQYPLPGALQAPLHHGINESDLPPDKLLHAVQAAIRKDRRHGFRKSVLEVSFGHPVLRPPSRLRWVPVAATVTEDPDTERLVVTLTDTRKWDVEAVTRVRQYMARLAAAEPRHPFVQQLRGQADRRLDPPESADVLFVQFSTAITRLAGAIPTDLVGRQQELNHLSTRLVDRIEALDRARASVTVVSRAAGHLWAAEELIGAARTQLVIVAPAIGYRALNPLLPALRAALDRRVQLIVLWGRTLADSLADPVRAAFDELASRYRSLVLIPDRSARTDVCAIVQDDTRALVGSHSPLEVDHGRESGTVSVLIEPPADSALPPAAVSELLAWARGAYPYWQDAQRIIVHRAEASAVGSEPEVPAVPVNVAEHADEAALGLLVATWQEYRAALSDGMRQGDAIGPVVELVTDGENQEFLWRAIRGNPTRRLILADDNVDAALFKRIVLALRERPPEVAIDVVCQSTTAGKIFSEVKDTRKEVRRAELRLHQRRVAARLVLADDEALIGSFSPLGDDGSRLAGAGVRRQLGLRIRGQAVAAELARSVQVTMSEADPAAAHEYLPRTHSAATAALPLLVEARRERQHTRFGSFIAARLAELDEPWTVLETWRDQSVPAEDLRPAAAALVRQMAPALRAAPADNPAVLPWVSWLLTDAWQRSRFMAAAVIAGLVPGADVAPAAAACLAAAPIEHGPLGESMIEPLLELSDVAGPSASAGAAGALAEMILWGGPEGRQGVELLAQFLPLSWRDFAAAAVRFYADTSGARVPVAQLTAELSRWDQATQTEDDWTALAERIDRLEQLRTRFTFESGAVMHAGLFDADGALTRIRVAARDDPSARDRLDMSLPMDVRAYLDGLVTAVGTPRVQWHKQLHFLSDITGIVRSARTLAAGRPSAGAAAAAIRSQACRDLAVAAAKGADELLADANGLPQPYGVPLRALLERLGPLTRWGTM